MDIKNYLGDMEASGLLLLLFNGYRYINGMQTVPSINARIALKDKGFCKYIKDNSDQEYNID